jgi:flagellar protein FlaG
MNVSTSLDLPPAAASVAEIGGGLPPSTSGNATPSVSSGATLGATPAAATSTTAAEVVSATQEITNYLNESKTDIQFAIDQSSGKVVVEIQDPTTGKTLRQIPNEVVLRIAQELQQNKTLGNLALSEKA